MKIMLAPMEGVIDHHMRQALTSVGGYDGCVTEFIRITDQCLPDRVFKRMSPELDQQGQTISGTPVILQLLGGDPSMMAANAQKAAQLGAPAIDINFGCPSKFVNRKMGGSVLLREPERVHAIVAAVRQAVDASIPVTAKMRLGYEDDALALDNALAIESAGAAELTVHARTKVEGYTPPARWEALAPLREALTIPLIANGDICSLDDYHRCVAVSGCVDVMLGRSALNDPSLARQIKQSSNREADTLNRPMDWHAITSLIRVTSEQMEQEYSSTHVVMRIKQWLGILRKNHPQGETVFNAIRQMKVLEDIKKVLGLSL
ncbi:MAG: tRNA-dihydrouridine synthase family protein [Gammaproteobacteria bacterium]|nr:tRNA-dihydrouridine synthase family protein [Gammaproteobacteria bacterium]